MSKFNKVFNTKIISAIIAVCFFNTLIYCSPVYSNAYTLRVPMDKDYGRFNKVISRRDFFKSSAKYAAFGFFMTKLPILMRGNSQKIIEAIANLDTYTLSFDYLSSLTKKEGSAYIQGIYYAVNANKIDRNQAEKFLRKIFNDEDLIWMREEAVKVLVKLDMIKEVELEKLIDTIPDATVLVAIASVFGEKEDPISVKFLIKWLDKEKTDIVKKEILSTLGKIGRRVPEVEEFIIKFSEKNASTYYVIWALGKISTEKSRNQILKLQKEDPYRDRMASYDFALTTSRMRDYSVEDLIKLAGEEYAIGSQMAIYEALGQKGTKEAADYIFKKYEINSGHPTVMRYMLFALGQAGAGDYLIQIKEEMENLREGSYYELNCLASALAQAGTKGSY